MSACLLKYILKYVCVLLEVVLQTLYVQYAFSPRRIALCDCSEDSKGVHTETSFSSSSTTAECVVLSKGKRVEQVLFEMIHNIFAVAGYISSNPFWHCHFVVRLAVPPTEDDAHVVEIVGCWDFSGLLL